MKSNPNKDTLYYISEYFLGSSYLPIILNEEIKEFNILNVIISQSPDCEKRIFRRTINNFCMKYFLFYVICDI